LVIQGDPKVSVHLTIAVKSSGAETFWSPCTSYCFVVPIYQHSALISLCILVINRGTERM